MDDITTVADMIMKSRQLVVFTGAGMSTESGISDFRSPGGIWSRFDPSEFTFQKFLSGEAAREKYWQFSSATWPEMVAAEPNAGHRAIFGLHRMDKLDCVITQNIDGLHQKSGIPEDRVIELHGTAWWVNCLECGSRYPREEVHKWVVAGEKVPKCSACGGIMKPATISFGQAMPEKEAGEAERRSAACDLFLAVGSSLVIYPAARMPLIARDSGARLVIINLEPTPHDGYAQVVINRKIGDALEGIMAKLKCGAG
ncbi:NAD-dependent deacetylase [Chloroflexota bacterium]